MLKYLDMNKYIRKIFGIVLVIMFFISCKTDKTNQEIANIKLNQSMENLLNSIDSLNSDLIKLHFNIIDFELMLNDSTKFKQIQKYKKTILKEMKEIK